MKPAVTVVIPAFNPGSLIDRALQSVMAQSLNELVEIIVVDDGSRDGTPLHVRRDYPHVRLITQSNAGTASARNTGLAEAEGRFVALLDQDDTWDSNKLSRQIPLFDNPTIGMVHAGGRFQDEFGRVTSVEPGVDDLDVHLLLSWCWVIQSTAVIRTDLLRSVGGFDCELSAADDWDLWIRLANVTKLAVIRDPLVSIMIHSGNQSNDAERMYIAANTLVAKHQRLHVGCALCMEALRHAALRNRREYYRRVREDAKHARRNGHRAVSLALTARALAKHPGAALDTYHHYLHRLKHLGEQK